MKRIFKLSIMSFVALFALFTLVGCAGINADFAVEIENKAKAEEHYTYDELVDKLGEPTINVSGAISLPGVEIKPTGIVQWSKGCADKAAFNAALEEGKTVPTLYVTFLNGKAVSAEYEEVTK
jgi:hypothetical protein